MADSDLDVADQGASAALNAEMQISEFLLRHWMKLAVAVVVVVVVIVGYGQYQAMAISTQRATTARIAEVESELPFDLLTIGQQKAFGGDIADIDVDAISEAAGKLGSIASEASGTAAIEAWLKAAELYRISGDATKRREALAAAAAQSTGVLRYAAVGALSNLDLEEGRVDEALAALRGLKSEPDFLARQATLDLATTLEALERPAEAVREYDDYLARWPDASDAEDVRVRREKARDNAG